MADMFCYIERGYFLPKQLYTERQYLISICGISLLLFQELYSSAYK